MAKKKLLYRYRKKRFVPPVLKVAFLIGLGLFIFLIPGQNVYTLNYSDLKIPDTEPDMPVPTAAPFPENSGVAFPDGVISAEAVVIRDVPSATNMYVKNGQEVLAPASTTKLLTAMVALDTYRLDDVVTVKTVANDGQVMGLIPGERITVENLLYGALIHSGNDAAYALAEYYPGGVPAFIEAMNKKAAALHLTGSHFTNPVGYDDPQHYMTAVDLAILAQAAISDPVILKMVAIPSITISDVTHTFYHPLRNVNQLLGKIPGVAGIKTGWTEAAGENLVTLVERNGHRVIFVVLKSQDRFADTTTLIDWVFTNYTWKTFTPEE